LGQNISERRHYAPKVALVSLHTIQIAAWLHCESECISLQVKSLHFHFYHCITAFSTWAEFLL